MIQTIPPTGLYHPHCGSPKGLGVIPMQNTKTKQQQSQTTTGGKPASLDAAAVDKYTEQQCRWAKRHTSNKESVAALIAEKQKIDGGGYWRWAKIVRKEIRQSPEYSAFCGRENNRLRKAFAERLANLVFENHAPNGADWQVVIDGDHLKVQRLRIYYDDDPGEWMNIESFPLDQKEQAITFLKEQQEKRDFTFGNTESCDECEKRFDEMGLSLQFSRRGRNMTICEECREHLASQGK